MTRDPDEMRAKFLNHVRERVYYWADQPFDEEEERLHALAFDILCIFDGVNCNMPGFQLITDGGIDISNGSLHDEYCEMVKWSDCRRDTKN